ncbi:MAG: hypothetical protein R6V58_14860 [Planctomycetota bacterium]
MLGIWTGAAGAGEIWAFDWGNSGEQTDGPYDWHAVRDNNLYSAGTQVVLPDAVEAGFHGGMHKDRGTGNLPGLLGGVDYTNLFRDAVVAQGISKPGTLMFEVKNLPPAEYYVTLLGGDTAWGTFSYDVNVNAIIQEHPGYPDDAASDITELFDPDVALTWDLTGDDMIGPGDPLQIIVADGGDSPRLSGVFIEQVPPPVEPIPEPAGLSLLGLALLALRRRRS